MTVRPRERQRAQQFALALNGASTDAGAVRLARVATALGGVSGTAPAPGEDFRAALRNRLVAVGAISRPAGGMPQAAPWRRRLVAASAALAISTGGAAATAVASTDALPGETLYDVKRAVEQVQLALAPTELARAERYLAIATTRLSEVRSLLAEHDGRTADPVLVAELRSTLAAMSEAVAAGSTHIFAVFERTRDVTVLVDLERFLAARAKGLAAVGELLPGELLGSQEVLVSELESLARRVAVVTGSAVDTGTGRIVAPAMSAAAATRSLVEPTGSALVSASRGYERETLAATITPVAPPVMADVRESVERTLAAAAEAAAETARESAARAEESRARSQQQNEANAERVERDVRKVVEIDAAGRSGRVSGVEVTVLPELSRGERQHVSTGELRERISGSEATSRAAKAGATASSRLLSVLPLPDVSIDAVVPGSLTSALDLAEARLSGKQLPADR